MLIDKKTVKKISNLAKIELSNNEVDIYLSQLNQIIEFMNKLDEVDTRKVENKKNNHTESYNHRKEDIIEEGNCVDKILKNAPESKEGFFTTIKVIE